MKESFIEECVSYLVTHVIRGGVIKKRMPETVEEAEDYLLGGLLFCGHEETARVFSSLECISGKIAFSNTDNQTIFNAMFELLKSRKTEGKDFIVDPMMLSEYLEAQGKLEEIGGRARLALLMDSVPAFSSECLDRSIEIIKKEMARRNDRSERLKVLQEGCKNAGPLMVNNILCLLHGDFERNVLLSIKDNDKRWIAVHTSNVLIDFILDRLAAISLASPVTEDVTESECRNLVSSCNRKSEDTDASDIPSGEF